MITFLIAALTLGFLGSFHCLGMCGPIALALPTGTAKGLKKTGLIISYNFGRMITYSVLGLIAGFIGKSFVIAGFQQLFSIVLGVAILSILLFSNAFPKTSKLHHQLFLIFAKIKTHLAQLLSGKGPSPLFLIGLLNGLLPCGLVYMGLAGALASGNIIHGAVFMAVFGLGTFPMMLLIPLATDYLSAKVRNQFRKIVPVFVGFMAVLLILRGLNLGIPMLSPQIKNAGSLTCHQTETKVTHTHLIKCSPHPAATKR